MLCLCDASEMAKHVVVFVVVVVAAQTETCNPWISLTRSPLHRTGSADTYPDSWLSWIFSVFEDPNSSYPELIWNWQFWKLTLDWTSMIKELKDGSEECFFGIVKYLEVQVQVEFFMRFYWLLSVMNCTAKLQELQRAAKDNQRQDPQRSEVSCEENGLQGNSLQLDFCRIRSTLCKAGANSLNLLSPFVSFVILLTFGTCWSREFPLQQLTVKVDVRMSTQASSPKQFRGLLWLGRILLIELLHSASCSVRSLA